MQLWVICALPPSFLPILCARVIAMFWEQADWWCHARYMGGPGRGDGGALWYHSAGVSLGAEPALQGASVQC